MSNDFIKSLERQVNSETEHLEAQALEEITSISKSQFVERELERIMEEREAVPCLTLKQIKDLKKECVSL